jgi:hypothetical protein
MSTGSKGKYNFEAHYKSQAQLRKLELPILMNFNDTLSFIDFNSQP